eukprot:6439357-Pyramimonas_sp.AAC.2
MSVGTRTAGPLSRAGRITYDVHSSIWSNARNHWWRPMHCARFRRSSVHMLRRSWRGCMRL